jgi:phosphomannomutase
MVSVSGIRGVVGDSLTPQVALDFVQSYAAYLQQTSEKPLVLLARDTRPTGEMMRHAALAALLASGVRVLDLGVVATPTLQFAIKRLSAQGAICITASHNPVEWNALKFFQPNGMYLDKEQGNEVIRINKEKSFACGKWDAMGTLELDQSGEAIEAHLNKILSLVDAEKIKARKFKVVLDACNGAGGTISPLLLERLGCEVSIINGDLHGVFAHNPEPLNENMAQLMSAVKETGADIGFAHDADADRVAVVTDAGEPIGEDYSLVWGVAHVLKNRMKGAVVTNLSTTSAVETVASMNGCETFRTPVGDANVSGQMKAVGAAIGGEGNGGVIWPEMQLGRDGIAAIALMLEFLAVEGKTASQIHAQLPRYTILKTTHDFPRERLGELFAHFKSKYTQATLDERDGLRLNFSDGSWVHVRGSGTEPIVRLILEARTPEQARDLQSEFRGEVEALANA